MKVTEGQKFSVPATNFGISASNEGYDLMFSVDGITYDKIGESVPAGENVAVINNPKHLIYDLVGNATDVLITY